MCPTSLESKNEGRWSATSPVRINWGCSQPCQGHCLFLRCLQRRRIPRYSHSRPSRVWATMLTQKCCTYTHQPSWDGDCLNSSPLSSKSTLGKTALWCISWGHWEPSHRASHPPNTDLARLPALLLRPSCDKGEAGPLPPKDPFSSRLPLQSFLLLFSKMSTCLLSFKCLPAQYTLSLLLLFSLCPSQSSGGELCLHAVQFLTSLSVFSPFQTGFFSYHSVRILLSPAPIPVSHSSPLASDTNN